MYGENGAVLLVSEGNNEWSLIRLDYDSCSFRKLNQFTSEYPKLVVINDEVIVVSLSYDSINAYDLKTGALVNSNPKGPDYWNIADHYGEPAANIAFWGWLDKDPMQLRWGYINLDTGEFVSLEEKMASEVKVFFSEDGYTAYLYNSGMNIAIFDLHSNKITGHIEIDYDNLLDIQYIGGNLLAMVTRQNDVRFYDMGTQKELAVISGLTDNIRSITYNANNGLAMIMGKIKPGFGITVFPPHTACIRQKSFCSSHRNMATTNRGILVIPRIPLMSEICPWG